MSNVLEEFHKRWNVIERECLSSVRRQIGVVCFDLTEINRDFQKSCKEWFEGKLSPYLWYDNLCQSNPEKAREFKEYIKNIRLNDVNVSKPSKLWAYITTVLTLPITYFGADYVTNWELLGKAVFSIGTTVLAWTVCQPKLHSQRNEYEESIVAGFKKQLDNHCAKLTQILS